MITLPLTKRQARKLLQMLNEKSVTDPELAQLYEFLQSKLRA